MIRLNYFAILLILLLTNGIGSVACSNSSFVGGGGTKNNQVATPSSGTATTPTSVQQTNPAALSPTTTSTATTTPSTLPMPPTSAVTQGSFTVWAAPNPPAAFQDYQIFIQVILPSNVTSYDKSDLSGNLVGSDDYTQGIGANEKPGGDPSQAETMQVSGNTARLAVWVPGACGGVNDTVNIHSNLLNESQAIKITFATSAVGTKYSACNAVFGQH